MIVRSWVEIIHYCEKSKIIMLKEVSIFRASLMDFTPSFVILVELKGKK